LTPWWPAPIEARHGRQLGHLSRADPRTLNALLEKAREAAEPDADTRGAR